MGIILVESQGASALDAEKFAWNKKWMGTDVMWTGERPVNTGARGIPNFALLDNEGKVIMMGNPMALHGKLTDAIDAEIEKATSAPEGTPKSLKKAYTTFAKGKYAKAIADIRKVAAKGGDGAEDAEALAQKFITRIEAKFARVDWLLEHGYLIEADEMFSGLVKSTKGLTEVAEKTTSMQETFGSDEMKGEMKAAKAFAKLEEKIQEDGLDAKLLKKLAKFAA
ncbi:MAG: hypothetical protein P1V35_03605, partial [Planctomycetota bacterium]|nr:hypothetical protein [Planctomycetota bacterium]